MRTRASAAWQEVCHDRRGWATKDEQGVEAHHELGAPDLVQGQIGRNVTESIYLSSGQRSQEKLEVHSSS